MENGLYGKYGGNDTKNDKTGKGKHMAKNLVSYHGKIDKAIHKEMKRYAISKDLTLIEYINSVIEKDLAEKGLLKTEPERQRELIK